MKFTEIDKILLFMALTFLFIAFLTIFLFNTTLGASLYVAYCFFAVIILINQKANKGKKTCLKNCWCGEKFWKLKILLATFSLSHWESTFSPM